LSRATGRAVRQGAPLKTGDSENKMPAKFLLVDDEEDYINTLSERLELRGLGADVVHDGAGALSYLARHEPDVVVLDIRMPGMDGIEVLRQIKRDHPTVEVVMATGHGSAVEEKLARQLGAFAYFGKPVDIAELSATMKEASAARRRQGQG
jgi:DNA-binding NtrC family response regulator